MIGAGARVGEVFAHSLDVAPEEGAGSGVVLTVDDLRGARRRKAPQRRVIIVCAQRRTTPGSSVTRSVERLMLRRFRLSRDPVGRSREIVQNDAEHACSGGGEGTTGSMPKRELERIDTPLRVIACGRLRRGGMPRGRGGQDRVDAVAGATSATHRTQTFSWDRTDHLGQLGADGTCRAYFEVTEANAAGPHHETLEKGPTAVTLPASGASFEGLELVFQP